MVVLERAAGFFLAATVLYLLWVFTRQTSDSAVWPALGVLGVTAALLAWTGRFPRSKTVQILAVLLAVAALGAALVLTRPSVSAPRTADGWQPFSQAALDESLASGRPVFVDGTAAWCATCQVNEAAVLNRADVRALFDRLNVVSLQADYTRPDPPGQGVAGFGEPRGAAGLRPSTARAARAVVPRTAHRRQLHEGAHAWKSRRSFPPHPPRGNDGVGLLGAVPGKHLLNPGTKGAASHRFEQRRQRTPVPERIPGDDGRESADRGFLARGGEDLGCQVNQPRR